MKRSIVVIAVLLVALQARSQKVAVGIKVGGNLTKISGKAFKEAFDFGYNAGAFAEIELNKSWGIQPEVLFNQVNTKTASGIDSVFNNWQQNISSVQLNYLTIPILLRVKINSLIALNFGPQFGLLLNKNESLWSNGQTAIKSGDLSALGGVTVSVRSFRFFGRYVIGLNNINDVPNSDKWRSQQIQLGAGFKF